jgi:hypothetical protein
MKNFKYFIGGILSVIVILPIINKLLELVDIWIEALKIKPANKILEHEKKVAVLSDFINPQEQYEFEYENFEDLDE